MELLFSTIIGAIIGLVVRYAVKGHRSYGVVLLPAIAAAVTSVVWVALLWSGLTFDGGWIWVISFVVAAAVSLIVAIQLPKHRASADEALMQKIARAA